MSLQVTPTGDINSDTENVPTIAVSSSNIAVWDEGTVVVSAATALNFIGVGVVAASVGAGVSSITISGAGVAVLDEGVSLTTNVGILDFVGAGVTATKSVVGGIDKVTITIPSGGGGGVALEYTGPTTITIDPSSLATSATFVAGRESNEIDNTTNLYLDAFVQGQITVGTTPGTGTQINVYVWGSHTSLATTAIDVLDGVDSTETITSVGVLQTMLRLAAVGIVDSTTSNRVYYFAPFSVAELFGFKMPQYWGLFISHNTTVNLNSTAANHVWKYTGIKLV